MEKSWAECEKGCGITEMLDDNYPSVELGDTIQLTKQQFPQVVLTNLVGSKSYHS